MKNERDAWVVFFEDVCVCVCVCVRGEVVIDVCVCYTWGGSRLLPNMWQTSVKVQRCADAT